MVLPGFHELLHLLARPLAVIQILDDAIVPSRGGQVSVLFFLKKKADH